MSIKLMSQVWELDLPPGEKLVLLALADQANDHGTNCWPSIATIMKRSGQSDRTVQRAIKSLCDAKLLRQTQRAGTSPQYHVLPPSDCHPRQNDTPDKVSPRQIVTPDTMTPTPDTMSPKPSRTTNSSTEAPPPSKKRATTTDPFPRPEWADRGHWQDFLANRKRKNLPKTASAHAKFLRDIERFTDADWPPGRILQHAAERGWGGIYDPRDNRNGQRPYNPRADDRPRSNLVAAAADDLARRAGGGPRILDH